MINLTRVRATLDEINSLVEELDGVDLDDSTFESAAGGPARRRAREEKARLSQSLNLLANRFDLAAALTRIEYFYAKGEHDPLQPGRDD